jgi:hypothetical protein
MAIFPFGQCPFMELGHTAYRSTAPVPYSTASSENRHGSMPPFGVPFPGHDVATPPREQPDGCVKSELGGDRGRFSPLAVGSSGSSGHESEPRNSHILGAFLNVQCVSTE